MNKGRVVPMPTTPDVKIRAQARSLPLGKCFINNKWEISQMASLVVSRKHANGKLTYGFYLVDLNLLGVKDCFCVFNGTRFEMEERIHAQVIEFIECDYALAHNIIYKGIAFAKYYGFEPVDEFTQTGIYILEENSENIPVMDIPLGKDGVPIVFTTHDRNMQREIAILEKTAGKDNYIVYDMDELMKKLFGDDDSDCVDNDFDDDFDDDDDDDEDDFFDDDDFDDFDDDDDDETQSYDFIMDEIEELGAEKYLEKYGEDMSTVQVLALTDFSYMEEFDIYTDESPILDLILDDDRYDPALDSPAELDKYNDALQSIINRLVDDVDAAYREMEELVDRHTDDPELGILQINLLRDLDMRSELENLTLFWYDRAPNHYGVRLVYAEWLTDMERFDEVLELFDFQPGLNALTTENKSFTEVMVSEFCACYVMAWLSKNDIEKAEPYYQILIILENWTPFVMNALLAMMAKKKEAIMEKTQR